MTIPNVDDLLLPFFKRNR